VTRVSRGLGRLRVVFDDPTLVANAGLVLVATLVETLGLEALIDATVGLPGGAGHRPGRKLLSLVHAMVAGASHIDHANVLRAGATGGVLGHRVMAPSTLGTFLRAFTFGHVAQLDKVIAEALRRAWSLPGVGPGRSRLVIDIDSTICEVTGKKKQGAAYGYTRVLGYHPLVASRAGSGEILAARMRKGSANTQRGAGQFVIELIARVRRAGAAGGIIVRMDSGFWSKKTIAILQDRKVRFTMTVRAADKGIAKAIATIAEDAWAPIAYPAGGVAQVAEVDYDGLRLVVRRTQVLGPDGATPLFATWAHHAFLSDLATDVVTLDAFHRNHAVVELAIRDLKEGAGLAHVPSGSYAANGAWLGAAVLAHNLIRWSALSGGIVKAGTGTVAATIRTRYLAIPARLVNRSGTPTLRGPARWPWATHFARALETLRALPAAVG